MLQILGTILFFVVCALLIVALSLYTAITVYDLYRGSKKK